MIASIFSLPRVSQAVETATGLAMLALARSEDHRPQWAEPSTCTITPRIERRRMKVLAMSLRGMPVYDIAKALNASEAIICKDRQRLEKEGLLTRKRVVPTGSMTDRAKLRRDKVLYLTRTGLNSQQIAAELGCTSASIRKDWCILRREGRL